MQQKDIIYLKDGRKLGKIIDADLDVNNGILKSLSVEKRGIKRFFSGESNVIIKFNQIKKIGEDVILVDTPR